MGATNANMYHAEHGESPSTAVVSAVAAYSGRSMLELPVLYESIDVDALDSMFHSWTQEDDRQQLSFTYADYQVTVYSSGTVDVQQAK